MIFQLHEKHGRHIAYTSQEAESNVKNGWRTVAREEFYGRKLPTEIIPAFELDNVQASSEETPVQDVAVPKKRGRTRLVSNS